VYQVGVVEGSVLAIRHGARERAKARGLYMDGEVVHFPGKPKIGPGKQER
jgi:hypothetical protein